MNGHQNYEVIVLGGGSMGMSAAWHLAQRGVRTLVLDRTEPPHTLGSHHGDTRLIRIAYAEGAKYVPLALRARELWLQLQAMHQERCGETAETLFAPIGVVSLLPPGSPNGRGIAESAEQYQLPLESCNAPAIRRRWPGFAVPDDYIALFDPLGGILFSESCLRAMKYEAQAHGASMRFEGTLEELEVSSGSVAVQWGGERYVADKLILAAGAGTPAVLERHFPGWNLPLQPVRKVVTWYRPQPEGGSHSENAALYRPDAMPGFTIATPYAEFYGFPDFGDGVKMGRHDGGTPCTLATVDRTVSMEDDEVQVVDEGLKRFLPGASGARIKSMVCLYTRTPDEDFIIDHAPGTSNLVIAAGFSGHGFKFSASVGEALADLALTGSSVLDVSAFRGDRWDP